ncbi:hypothetical protein JOL62DRAFT_614791 [Phyllosticta paracitricarpa]|uniref:Uncharacterized protein n=2 Tax=Phyllosticta TaxID=121621 RepID=A0ABR1LLD1_9PEZI
MADPDKAPRLRKIPTFKDMRANLSAGSSKTSKGLKKKVTKSISGLRNAFQRDASPDPFPPVRAKSPSAQLASARTESMMALLPGRDRLASSTAIHAFNQEDGNELYKGDEGKYENKIIIGRFFARFQEAVQLARDKRTDECHEECLKLLQARISDGLRYEVLMLMTSISAHREALASAEQLKKHCKVMEQHADHVKRQIQEQGESWDG